ncbi:MAG: hypothetical protein ACTSWQ_05015 [Candidatus Thorarchaeota archaeon]
MRVTVRLTFSESHSAYLVALREQTNIPIATYIRHLVQADKLGLNNARPTVSTEVRETRTQTRTVKVQHSVQQAELLKELKTKLTERAKRTEMIQ